MESMKAALIYEPGGPEVLKVESRLIAKPQAGEVLIQVKAFGLNQVRVVHSAGSFSWCRFSSGPRHRGYRPGRGRSRGEFTKGDIVATAMGGMGRDFDGAYAEYACVPVIQVQLIKTSLPWETLGALPEMLQTA